MACWNTLLHNSLRSPLETSLTSWLLQEGVGGKSSRVQEHALGSAYITLLIQRTEKCKCNRNLINAKPIDKCKCNLQSVSVPLHPRD